MTFRSTPASFRRALAPMAVAFALACAGLSGCGTQAATPSAERGEAPMRPTVMALMASARANGQQFGGQLVLPAIWLFDAEGRQHFQATTEDDAERLPDVVAGNQPGNLDSGMMDLATVAGALDPALGIPTPAPGRTRWTAVVWMTDHACSPVCERLKSAASGLSGLDDQVDVVTVTLLTAQ